MFEARGPRLARPQPPTGPASASGRERPAPAAPPTACPATPWCSRPHAQRREKLRPGRLRVGLGGDLGVGGQLEVVAHRVQHRGQRSPPSSDGVPPPTNTVCTGRCAQPRGRQLKLGPQRLQPCVGVDPAQFGRGVGVEVAVAAAGCAERHMHVDAERPAGLSCTSGRSTGEDAVMSCSISSSTGPTVQRWQLDTRGFARISEPSVSGARSFAHCEENSTLVAGGPRHPWHNGRVTVAARSQFRIALVARRHVDFKRVCSCRCLP